MTNEQVLGIVFFALPEGFSIWKHPGSGMQVFPLCNTSDGRCSDLVGVFIAHNELGATDICGVQFKPVDWKRELPIAVEQAVAYLSDGKHEAFDDSNQPPFVYIQGESAMVETVQ